MDYSYIYDLEKTQLYLPQIRFEIVRYVKINHDLLCFIELQLLYRVQSLPHTNSTKLISSEIT